MPRNLSRTPSLIALIVLGFSSLASLPLASAESVELESAFGRPGYGHRPGYPDRPRYPDHDHGRVSRERLLALTNQLESATRLAEYHYSRFDPEGGKNYEQMRMTFVLAEMTSVADSMNDEARSRYLDTLEIVHGTRKMQQLLSDAHYLLRIMDDRPHYDLRQDLREIQRITMELDRCF